MKLFKYTFYVLFFFLISSCTTESTPVYQLIVTANPSEAGTVSPSSGEYEDGEQVTITATPHEHWVLQNWSGDGMGTSSSITITMDNDKNVVGNFSERLYPLNITIEGEGSVDEEVIQSKSEFTNGTVVQLTPNPSNGWSFVEWNGDVTSTDEVIEVTVGGEINVTVTFARKDYPLTINIEGEGDVDQEIISQAKTTEYQYETVVKLTPKPAEGWSFMEWSGNIESTEQVVEVTITGETAITANFEKSFYLHANGVTIMCPSAKIGETGRFFGTTYVKRTREQITIRNASSSCTSGILIMDFFADEPNFNEDISTWDVSSVRDLSGMFHNARSFNQDIGNWDVSSVEFMNGMFYRAENFNQDIGNWDVSSVEYMNSMFSRAENFNQDIGNWDVSSVEYMNDMFYSANNFNKDIGNWDVSSVRDMSGMFWGANNFNKDIDNWDVSSVSNMNRMFDNATIFNQDIGNWDVSSVRYMDSMFFRAESFNQDIGNWDVSSVENMNRMFWVASSFNKNLRLWCVEKIISEPDNFSSESALSEEYKPLWGTCPD